MAALPSTQLRQHMARLRVRLLERTRDHEVPLVLWSSLLGLAYPLAYASQPVGPPTEALPGTPEKIAVLAARRAAGQTLFNAADGDCLRDDRQALRTRHDATGHLHICDQIQVDARTTESLSGAESLFVRRRGRNNRDE